MRTLDKGDRYFVIKARFKEDDCQPSKFDKLKFNKTWENSGLEVIACGSYRRGKPTCGDLDILITHHDDVILEGFFDQLLDKLRCQFYTNFMMTALII